MTIAKRAWGNRDAEIIELPVHDGRDTSKGGTRGSTVIVKHPKANYGLLINYIDTTNGCFDCLPVELIENPDGTFSVARCPDGHVLFRGRLNIYGWNTGTTMFRTGLDSDKYEEGDPSLVVFIPPDRE
jgi:hypothetical protein